MPKLHVHTAFELRHDDGTTEKFSVGQHDFPTPIAAHWYVKHHTRAAADVAASVKQDDDVDSGFAAREAELNAAADFLRQEKAALDQRVAEHDQREKAFEARVAEFEAAQRAAAAAAAESAQQGAAGNQQKHQGGKRQS